MKLRGKKTEEDDKLLEVIIKEILEKASALCRQV